MKKQFKDVAVGVKFTMNGVEFTKIPDERVSCCKVINAQNASTQEKIMVLPLDEVDAAE